MNLAKWRRQGFLFKSRISIPGRWTVIYLPIFKDFRQSGTGGGEERSRNVGKWGGRNVGSRFKTQNSRLSLFIIAEFHLISQKSYSEIFLTSSL